MEPQPAPGEATGVGRRGWDRRRTIWAAIAAVVVLGVVVLLVVGLVNRDVGTSIQDALDEGERPEAPALSLPVLVAGDGIGPRGATASLEQLRGRTVVLNFWASWCDPCVREAPVLDGIARRYRPAGDVVVLGVDVQDLREKALRFAERHGMSYPSLRDGSDDAYRAYELTGLPETFVIDPEGRIALHKIGEISSPEEITTAVDQLSASAGAGG